jgi:hypothetical protein
MRTQILITEKDVQYMILAGVCGEVNGVCGVPLQAARLPFRKEKTPGPGHYRMEPSYPYLWF